MKIVITGCPGTGKTSVAKKLSEAIGCELFEIKKLVEENKLCSDSEGERIVDIGQLRIFMDSFLKGKDDFVVEGHLACEFEIPNDFIFVLRADPRELRKRLGKRGYSDPKTNENILSELLDYCFQRTVLVYGKEPLELDTSGKNPEECAEILFDAVKKNKKNLDRVNYSGYLKKYLGLVVDERRKKSD